MNSKAWGSEVRVLRHFKAVLAWEDLARLKMTMTLNNNINYSWKANSLDNNASNKKIFTNSCENSDRDSFRLRGQNHKMALLSAVVLTGQSIKIIKFN